MGIRGSKLSVSKPNNKRTQNIMKLVIATLEHALETMLTNEPINRREGNIEQANLEAQSAAEIREALHILKAVMAARNWPVYHTQVPLPNNSDQQRRAPGNQQ